MPQAAVQGPAQEWDWTAAYKTFYDPDDEAESGTAAEEAARHPATSCSHDHKSEREIYDLPLDEKVRRMETFHRKGNAFFEEGQYDRAYLQYRHLMVYYEYTFPVRVILFPETALPTPQGHGHTHTHTTRAPPHYIPQGGRRTT